MIWFWRYIRLTLSCSFILLAVSTFAWFFFPSFRTFLAGFALGTLVSICNGIILVVKTVKVSEYALKLSNKRQGTGTLQRFLLAGLAGYAAVKYPATFHWIGVIVGLSTVTILSLIIAFIAHLKSTFGIERGER